MYRDEQRRVDTSRLYVRNAVHNYKLKEAARGEDWSELKEETGKLGRLLKQYEPPLVFTFGAVAFEFARRSLSECEERAYKYWSTKLLGEQFRRRVNGFTLGRPNVIPLLHSSIARGKFLVSHHYFTCVEDGNYFDYVADKVSPLLLNHKDCLDIWVS